MRQITLRSLNKKLAAQRRRYRQLSALSSAHNHVAMQLNIVLAPIIVDILNEEAKSTFPFMFRVSLIEKKLRERGVVCSPSILWKVIENFDEVTGWERLASAKNAQQFFEALCPVIQRVEDSYYDFAYSSPPGNLKPWINFPKQ